MTIALPCGASPGVGGSGQEIQAVSEADPVICQIRACRLSLLTSTRLERSHANQAEISLVSMSSAGAQTNQRQQRQPPRPPRGAQVQRVLTGPGKERLGVCLAEEVDWSGTGIQLGVLDHRIPMTTVQQPRLKRIAEGSPQPYMKSKPKFKTPYSSARHPRPSGFHLASSPTTSLPPCAFSSAPISQSSFPCTHTTLFSSSPPLAPLSLQVPSPSVFTEVC